MRAFILTRKLDWYLKKNSRDNIIFLKYFLDPRNSTDRGVFVCKQLGTMDSYVP